MKNEYDVICVGHTVIDVMALNLGDIDFSLGDRVEAEDLVVRPGGDALNQSLLLGSAGLKTGLFTVAGDEFLYQKVRESLERYSVERLDDTAAHGARTPVSVVLLDKKGERKFISHRPEYEKEIPIPYSLLENTKFLSYASFHGCKPLDRVALSLFKAARERGVKICADMTGGGRYTEQVVEACFPYIDYFMPSLKEAQILTGRTSWSGIAESLHGAGCGTVVLKLGAEGCYISGSGVERHLKAYGDIEIMDTTGAGDAFVAGFLVALCRGDRLEAAALFAQAAAAVTIGRIGASGIDNVLDEINVFRRENKWHL